MSFRATAAQATPVSYELEWGVVRGLCWGDPNNVTVIATHGWLDNCHSFLPLAEHWNSDHGGLIALDWAGHGHSDHRPRGTHYHFIDYAYDLWQILTHHINSPVTLLGHSMGGFVSNVVASICPEKVDKLILVEAFGLLVSDEMNAREQLAKGFSSRYKKRSGRWRGYSTLDTAIHARAAQADFSRDLVALLVDRGLHKASDHSFSWRADPRVKSVSPYRLHSTAVDELLQGLTMPVKVVRGDKGHENLSRAIEKWQHQVTDLNLITLNGGHHVHMEQPEKIAELLKSSG